MKEIADIKEDAIIESDAVTKEAEKRFSEDIGERIQDRKYSNSSGIHIRKVSSQDLLRRLYMTPDPKIYLNDEPEEETGTFEEIREEYIRLYKEIEETCGDWDDEGEVTQEVWQKALQIDPVIVD